MPHWLASPLAIDRLLHSRPGLADLLSDLGTDKGPSPPQVRLVDVQPDVTAMAAISALRVEPPAAKADIGAQLVAVAESVLGVSLTASQPLMEVGLM